MKILSNILLWLCVFGNYGHFPLVAMQGSGVASAAAGQAQNHGHRRGLWSGKNSCYFNATVQCLTACLPKGLRSNEPLINDLQRIKLSLSSKDGSNAIDGTDLLGEAIKESQKNRLSEDFGLHKEKQEDARELLSIFLKKIQNSCKSFNTNIKSVTTSSDCGHLWENQDEPLPFLSVTIKGQTLDDCLDDYFAQNVIKDFSCDECSKETKIGTREAKAVSLPQTLIVQLIRFNGAAKINTPISFPLEKLTLPNIGETEASKVFNHKYALKGIVLHSGDLTGGHYIAYVNDNGQWFSCNDTRVASVDKEEVMRITGTGKLSDFTPYLPYLLFYGYTDKKPTSVVKEAARQERKKAKAQASAAQSEPTPQQQESKKAAEPKAPAESSKQPLKQPQDPILMLKKQFEQMKKDEPTNVDRYTARVTALESTLKNSTSSTKPYVSNPAIEKHSKAIFDKHFISCTGTATQHNIHQEMVELLRHIAEVCDEWGLDAKDINKILHVKNIYPVILSYLSLVNDYKNANHLQQAYALLDFCWKLSAVQDAIVNLFKAYASCFWRPIGACFEHIGASIPLVNKVVEEINYTITFRNRFSNAAKEHKELATNVEREIKAAGRALKIALRLAYLDGETFNSKVISEVTPIIQELDTNKIDAGEKAITFVTTKFLDGEFPTKTIGGRLWDSKEDQAKAVLLVLSKYLTSEANIANDPKTGVFSNSYVLSPLRKVYEIALKECLDEKLEVQKKKSQGFSSVECQVKEADLDPETPKKPTPDAQPQKPSPGDVEFDSTTYDHAVAGKKDLKKAKLQGADLRQIPLDGVDLSGANLKGANLREVSFKGAILTGVDFTGADLTEADFTGAWIKGANFTKACLVGANLTKVTASKSTIFIKAHPGLKAGEFGVQDESYWFFT